MKRKSKDPLAVGYAELIDEARRLDANADQTFPALVASGAMPAWTARRRRTVYQVLLQLLKKHEKNPQLNLADMHAQLQAEAAAALNPPLHDDPDFYTTRD
jgi:hypothetical protein